MLSFILTVFFTSGDTVLQIFTAFLSAFRQDSLRIILSLGLGYRQNRVACLYTRLSIQSL